MPNALSTLPRRGSQTLEELRDLQRLAAGAIMRPLTSRYRAQRRQSGGRDAATVVQTFIKPNDRLTSFERLEIYNRQYWFRLIDVLHDDFPGVRAVVGARPFQKLIVAYLEKYPSRCSSLRNLGDRLPRFLLERPQLAGDSAARQRMAHEMAGFEWAQIVAFDGPAEPILSVDDLLGRNPAKLTLGVQPYLTALQMHWPLDEFSLALRRQETRSDASNAIDEPKPRPAPCGKKPRLPRAQQINLIVHRLDNSIYYKRLDAPAFALLTALRGGRTLLQACAAATNAPGGQDATAEQIKQWLQSWSSMGWFCRRRAGRSNQ